MEPFFFLRHKWDCINQMKSRYNPNRYDPEEHQELLSCISNLANSWLALLHII
jgi:hypothetical protein